MNSTDIFLSIEEIAKISSKLGKQQGVRLGCEDEEFRRVARAGLDPFVTYGIAAVPAREPAKAFGHFTLRTWDLLRKLADRSLTGGAARSAVADQLGRLNEASAELLKRIITKDLRAGFSANTVNKACPGLIPTFDCMLAHPFESKRITSWPVFVEPKLDGVRVLAFVDLSPTPTVRFYSRSGKEFMTFEHLKQPIIGAIQALSEGPATECGASLVMDGEVVSGSFNKTVGDVRRSSGQATDARFIVFDLLTREEFNAVDAKGRCMDAGTYQQRRTRLLDTLLTTTVRELAAGGIRLPVSAVPSFKVGALEEVHGIYGTWRAIGLEGAIVKLPDAYYRRDRDYGWMKLKAEESADVRIVGAFEGEGKYVGALGGVVVDFKGVRVRVGSGLSDEQRTEFYQAWRHDTGPGRTHYEGQVGDLVGRLCEVVYHEVTPDGSLRHPRFRRFRDDKAA